MHYFISKIDVFIQPGVGCIKMTEGHCQIIVALKKNVDFLTIVNNVPTLVFKQNIDFFY